MPDVPSASFFDRHPAEVARDLIGVELAAGGAAGVIVETEAYATDDPASHSFRGPTSRNAAMFGAPGTAYVYRSYGLHWCLNIVCISGSAVLLRALEPVGGLDLMRKRRGLEAPRLLCAGPGRLAQALGVDAAWNGLPMHQVMRRHSNPEIVAGVRVGISKAVDIEWRFAEAGSLYLSRPLKPQVKANEARLRPAKKTR
ncbi:DNA-3-methyladenine glycosylase [Aliihoeflea sp. PC F10.4]